MKTIQVEQSRLERSNSGPQRLPSELGESIFNVISWQTKWRKEIGYHHQHNNKMFTGTYTIEKATILVGFRYPDTFHKIYFFCLLKLTKNAKVY